MNRSGILMRSAIGGLLLAAGPLFAAEIHTTDKYAWSETAGWINHRATHGQVQVFSDHLEGFAWGEGIGWVKLGSHSGGGTHSYANTGAADWGVNRDEAGKLSGYGWSETSGWVNFHPTHGQVAIDIATGRFSGYAWGEGIGWVHFANDLPEYRVALEPLALAVQAGVGGSASGGGSFIPFSPVALSFVADAGFTFAAWSPAPCAAEFSMPGEALTCTVTFVQFEGGQSCGSAVVLSGQSYPDGTHLVQSETTIVAKGDAVVALGAVVYYEAGQSITLKPDFHVASGGYFHAGIAEVICSAGRSAPQAARAVTQQRRAGSPLDLPSARVLAWDDIPDGLARLLEGAGDRAFFTDQSGNRIVFATEAELLAVDTNGQSDIYLYEVDAERLTALSLAPSGWTANGDSREPRIDGGGHFVAFSSEADDLTAADRNGVSDIFLLDLDSHALVRMTGDAAGLSARRPDLSADAATLVFEQQGASGRQVLTLEAGELLPVGDDLPSGVERHHPAISADGRYLAYLATDGAGCEVRFLDRQQGQMAQADCPAALMGREDAVPLFDAVSGWLIWEVPGEGRLEVRATGL